MRSARVPWLLPVVCVAAAAGSPSPAQAADNICGKKSRNGELILGAYNPKSAPGSGDDPTTVSVGRDETGETEIEFTIYGCRFPASEIGKGLAASSM